ncbi:MAG TPA: permease prefix domain 1-containing protein, partial [Candidatus Sulfopaludibacter sp.]|nr:permease prefix domain 1-containing protein [Candidatus Sulfopaludibacter sp.]
MIRRAWNRALAVFRGAPLDTELDAEIASHLDAAIEDNLRQGMPPEEARRRALVRFGGISRAMEQHREARGLPGLDVLRQDLRFAA